MLRDFFFKVSSSCRLNKLPVTKASVFATYGQNIHSMKAITYPRYGGPEVLQLKEVPSPTPKDKEVLVKVHAASVNPLDWHLMRGTPYLVRLISGLFRPKVKILGADIAGTVEAVGSQVTQFKAGDEVYGEVSKTGFAEYSCVQEKLLAHKPATITFEMAAAIPVAALTALQGLRDHGNIQPGQQVLINGASGGVGTFAVQIAKAFGAEVTGVCSTRNVETARAIGADHVIDYKLEDFTQNGKQYDLILDMVANYTAAEYKGSLSPGGNCVVVGFSTASHMMKIMLASSKKAQAHKQNILTFTAKPNQADLIFLNSLLETGKVVPVIDRSYPLAQTAEAIAYLEEGHAQGKILISIEK